MEIIKIEEDVNVMGKKISLIDLNGSQSNFETKFQITSQPGARYVVSVISQDELDSGDFQFEACDTDGSFSRKIIRQDQHHQNFYIGIKRHPDADGGPDGVIKCHVIKRMRKLPPNESYALPPREGQQDVKEVQNVEQQEDASDSRPQATSVIQNNQALTQVPKDVDYNTLFIVGVVFIVIAMVIFNKK